MSGMRTKSVNSPVAPDGTCHGDRVPGSRFYRAFCPDCKTPMRVTQERIQFDVQTYCEDCNPPAVRFRVGNPHSDLNGIEADWDAYARAENG